MKKVLIKTWTEKIREGVLDLIFPKFCLGCGKEGVWLCQKCSEKIVLVKTQVCPECGRISPLGRYCLKDKKPWGLSGVVVSSYYREGPVKEIIHNFKYNHILELGDILALLLEETFRESGLNRKDYLVTAVPLHYLRRAQRGYNQSEILAQKFTKVMGFESDFSVLIKKRKTKPQVAVNEKDRRQNVKGSFILKDKKAVKGREIVLIDDVITTGSTLNECAKVLRAAGAKRVWGLVVAKG